MTAPAVTFGVLGPVTATDPSGASIALRGPRHREVLARLLVARGRVVPVQAIVDDLWGGEAPPTAPAAVRTFVAALRRATEPDRAPRTAPTLIRTEGPGYSVALAPDAVDAWQFTDAVTVASSRPPADRVVLLETALGYWRGPAYADFLDRPWTHAERARLSEIRAGAVEQLADAHLSTGQATVAIPALDHHVAVHPWREEGWRLLALALYREDRQGDALAVLRSARSRLGDELGIDPGPRLSDLEEAILRRDTGLGSSRSRDEDTWSRASATYGRTVTPGSAARLESTVGVLRGLAVTGGPGLVAAREQRLSTIHTAEKTGDPELVARVIGGFDVPGIWSRSDDPVQAKAIVEAAERTLAAIDDERHRTARTRLLTTIATESRGTPGPRGRGAALAAVESARTLGDPAVLASALGAEFLQTFHRTGLAAERGRIGREITGIGRRHDLVNAEVLGLLIEMQSHCAAGDLDDADALAGRIDDLAHRHERPLALVFTRWCRALRIESLIDDVDVIDQVYHRAADEPSEAGMPGVTDGLLPLSLLCARVRRRRPVDLADHTDFGPYEPWARPHLLLAAGRRAEATAELHRLPTPPPDHMMEALWCLAARAATEVGDHAVMVAARTALTPARAESAAGSGMLTAGPVCDYLDAIDRELGGRVTY